MKTSRYTAEQVAFALRQAESGTPVSDICRKIGIAEQTFYRWKKKYIGTGMAEVRRLSLLEEEKVKWQKVRMSAEDIAWIEEASKALGQEPIRLDSFSGGRSVA